MLEATNLDPDIAWAHVGLGDVYTAQGRVAEAQVAYQQAIACFEQMLMRGSTQSQGVLEQLGNTYAVYLSGLSLLLPKLW